MGFKIQASAKQSLCFSCNGGHVAEFDDGSVAVLCQAGLRTVQILRPVVRCSEYTDRASTSKFDMEKIAWTIKTNASGKAIGFDRPKKED